MKRKAIDKVTPELLASLPLPDRQDLIKGPELLKMFQVSHQTLHKWMNDHGFPRPFVFGEKTRRWSLLEVVEWVYSRKRG